MDAPGIIRQQYNFKRLSLTDFVIEIPRLPAKKVLKAALAKVRAHCAEQELGQPFTPGGGKPLGPFSPVRLCERA